MFVGVRARLLSIRIFCRIWRIGRAAAAGTVNGSEIPRIGVMRSVVDIAI
jgi:hypothetical protein